MRRRSISTHGAVAGRQPPKTTASPETTADGTSESAAPIRTRQKESLLISVEQGLLLGIEAAATLLSIGRTKMYELIQRGEIPVVRIGRRTLVHRDDLETFARALRNR